MGSGTNACFIRTLLFEQHRGLDRSSLHCVQCFFVATELRRTLREQSLPKHISQAPRTLRSSQIIPQTPTPSFHLCLQCSLYKHDIKRFNLLACFSFL